MNQSPEAIEAQEELAFQRETLQAQARNALDHQRAEIDKAKAIAACWWMLSLLLFIGTVVGTIYAVKVIL